MVGENIIMRSFISSTFPPALITAIKKRRMKWEGNVARIKRS
jgi:hypothetical protein